MVALWGLKEKSLLSIELNLGRQNQERKTYALGSNNVFELLDQVVPKASASQLFAYVIQCV